MLNLLLISALLGPLMDDSYKNRVALLKVIKESNVESVERLVQELDSFTENDKTKLLEVAKKMSTKREASFSLLKDRLDKGRIACFLASFSAFFVAAFKNKDASFKEFCKPTMGVTLVSALGGVAYNKLANNYLVKAEILLSHAKKIEQSVSAIVVSSELPKK
ncbi:hypothetical protein H0W26_00655 [Candidatus Dependentiae bacterium]|nr:hypothetical protein [Candidatus Dependentiae bacterium]